MSSLSSFKFDGQIVEAFVDDQGRDWFRGTQVCKILEIGDAYSAINRYAQEYSREWKVGEGRPALYVSEPGLYALIFASKSLASKKFQRWVFEEVLPKLRKTGIAADESRFNATEISKLMQVVSEREIRIRNLEEKNEWLEEKTECLSIMLQSTIPADNRIFRLNVQFLANQLAWLCTNVLNPQQRESLIFEIFVQSNHRLFLKPVPFFKPIQEEIDIDRFPYWKTAQEWLEEIDIYLEDGLGLPPEIDFIP